MNTSRLFTALFHSHQDVSVFVSVRETSSPLKCLWFCIVVVLNAPGAFDKYSYFCKTEKLIVISSVKPQNKF